MRTIFSFLLLATVLLSNFANAGGVAIVIGGQKGYVSNNSDLPAQIGGNSQFGNLTIPGKIGYAPKVNLDPTLSKNKATQKDTPLIGDKFSKELTRSKFLPAGFAIKVEESEAKVLFIQKQQSELVFDMVQPGEKSPQRYQQRAEEFVGQDVKVYEALKESYNTKNWAPVRSN